MPQFDKSILFLSAFGQPCNMPFAGTAVNENFKSVTDADNPIVAPWTSATPLSGELLQASLDALLQNDINLLSAYPDAYLKTQYDGNTSNLQQFLYAPAGAGQVVESGSNGWTNSVVVSAVAGTLPGEASGVMLGALVPATPFQQGRAWNYGVFGVDRGVPTWFEVDPRKTMVKPPEDVYSTGFAHYDNTVVSPVLSLVNSAERKEIHDATPNYDIVVSGDFKEGQIVDLSVDYSEVYVVDAAGSFVAGSDFDVDVHLCSATSAGQYDRILAPGSTYDTGSLFQSFTTRATVVEKPRSDKKASIRIEGKLKVNSDFPGGYLGVRVKRVDNGSTGGVGPGDYRILTGTRADYEECGWKKTRLVRFRVNEPGKYVLADGYVPNLNASV